MKNRFMMIKNNNNYTDNFGKMMSMKEWENIIVKKNDRREEPEEG